MTSKERVLTAFARQEPDRVPVNYKANPGIDGRLKAHFGLAQSNDEGLRQALGVDIRQVQAKYIGPPLHEAIPDRMIHPEWGYRMRWIEHETGGYWDYCDFPLKDADEEKAASWPLPNPDDYNYDAAAEQCRGYKPYCVVAGGAGNGDIINKAGMIRTMDQVLVDLITDDPVFRIIVDRRLDVSLEVTRRTVEAAGDAVDMIWIGEDLGTQRAPMISLELFRRQIRPRLQRYVDLAKSFDLPVMIHSCGSSSWAFDDFKQMGIDVVDTLQPEAEKMAPAYIKDRFGNGLAFHGCISTAGPVATGTVEDVKQNVKETLDIMMPGGGYCLAPTHQLQDNSPTENVLAVYQAAAEFGSYS
jgi:uroporphyrinogen decarboxylase